MADRPEPVRAQSAKGPGAPRPAEPPQSPKGTHDILWPESVRWERLIGTFASLSERAAYGLIQSPLFEYAEVFRRGIGEGSEVVGKEMYEFAEPRRQRCWPCGPKAPPRSSGPTSSTARHCPGRPGT